MGKRSAYWNTGFPLGGVVRAEMRSGPTLPEHSKFRQVEYSVAFTLPGARSAVKGFPVARIDRKPRSAKDLWWRARFLPRCSNTIITFNDGEWLSQHRVLSPGVSTRTDRRPSLPEP